MVALESEPLPYRRHDQLLTPAELAFFRVLMSIVRNRGVYVFTKVRMGDLMYVPKGAHAWKKHWYKISAKHVDFVLCDSYTVQPLAVIELDDSSHQLPDRVERDQFVEQAYRAVGIPLLRFPVRHTYNTQDIEDQVKRVLGGYAKSVSLEI